jgi:GntR family transcriptional regulator
MLSFPIELKSGPPVSEQLVYAVKKAIIGGTLQPGQRFPSVRVLSQELRINPNTAHKAVGLLIEEGLLQARPGIGTVVGEHRAATRQERSALLGGQAERLVVEAKKLRLELDDVQRAVADHWNHLTGN